MQGASKSEYLCAETRDIDAVYVSRIAYSDQINEAFTSLSQERKPPVTLRELLTQSQIKDILKEAIPDIKDSEVERVSNWAIVSVYDNNSASIPDHTGFYGCAVDTGNGNLVVGFRGSESFDNYDNRVHDWSRQNLAFLNSDGNTPQELDTEKFMLSLKKEGVFDAYSSISATGHSLGGRLAVHFAVLLAENNLDDKLSRVVSYDGPGASDEYNTKYKYALERIKDKSTVYVWSLVGSMLNEFSGIPRQYLKTTNRSTGLGGIFYLMGVHALINLQYDENGNTIIEPNPDAYPMYIGENMKAIDSLPAEIGNHYRDELARRLEMAGEGNLIGYIHLVSYLPQIFRIANIARYYELYKSLDEKTIIELLKCPKTKEDKESNAYIALLLYICDELEKTKKDNPSLFDQLIAVGKKFLDFVAYICGVDISRASTVELTVDYDPKINVSTTLLHSYADQLQKVKRRLDGLQFHIRQCSFFQDSQGLADLARSNPLIGSETVINQACRYLNETADEFDSVEEYLRSL